MHSFSDLSKRDMNSLVKEKFSKFEFIHVLGIKLVGFFFFFSASLGFDEIEKTVITSQN